MFDPSTLSPEALAYVDRERTRASQTARANARKELMKDESFLNEVRQGMQTQVQQTVEEQNQMQIKALTRKLAVSEVSRVLSDANLPSDQLESYVNMFVTDDIDKSVELASNFVSLFNTSLQNAKEAQQISAVQNMTTPQSAVATVSEQQALQARLDEVRKNASFRSKDVQISAILREAQQKGITLI